MKINKLTIFCLVVIVIFAAFLRFYKLDQVPLSLNWDEVAAGYNAYAIANWGQDEWGNTFPYIFKSFLDDKHPVHIYTAAIIIKIFGLSDFVTRSPGALFGVFNVILIFFLSRTIFKNDTVALFSSLLLAISPYNIHFSRGLWETNFALFYFMLGLLLFYQGMARKNWLLTFAFLSFVLSMMSYHSSKVVIPVMIFVLIALYFKRLIRLKWKFYAGIAIFLLFIVCVVLDPRLSGLARASQTKFPDNIIEKNEVFQQTGNKNLALASIMINQYFLHFGPDYLYKFGDPSPRNSSNHLGQFYRLEVFYFIIGLLLLIYYRKKSALVLIAWLLIAPLPSAVVQGAPNATRALFMMGVFQIIAAFGIWQFLKLLRKKHLKIAVTGFIIVAFIFSLKEYTDYYFTKYAEKEIFSWQYGMKQIVENVKKHPEYTTVYMTDVRSQPYIFFLYYLKTPLPEYRKSVVLNTEEKTYRYNLVSQFDKYHFGGWDERESEPKPGTMYIVEPSKYSGLRHAQAFYTIELVEFPNGDPAFYMVGQGY